VSCNVTTWQAIPRAGRARRAGGYVHWSDQRCDHDERRGATRRGSTKEGVRQSNKLNLRIEPALLRKIWSSLAGPDRWILINVDNFNAGYWLGLRNDSCRFFKYENSVLAFWKASKLEIMDLLIS